MACRPGGCQSGCDEEDVGEKSAAGNENRHGTCVKCKSKAAVGGTSGQLGSHCFECFRNNVYSKFRSAVTSNSLILPSDNVLVGISGGSSSRVVLQFLHEMQCRSQKNSDASREKLLPVFGVGVAFIDETAVCPSSCDDAMREMESSVKRVSPPEKKFHHIRIESIYGSGRGRREDRLKDLLNTMTDATGRDDILQQFRMLALQKAAADNGYTKILLGTCASRIACHVISMTVKGQGYSLPADIQYADARWEIPVVLPMRDCLAWELEFICHTERLETNVALKVPPSGINALVSSFVSLLQRENLSRESTIVRTGGKLTPFCFNRMPNPKGLDSQSSGSMMADSLCVICYRPLRPSGTCEFPDSPFMGACCLSCRSQTIPSDSSSFVRFHSCLPELILNRFNGRNRDATMEEYLLSDEEHEC